jgi:hypothetical protein
MIYDIPFPIGFDLANSVQPEPVYGADGSWYFTVYGRIQKDAPALTYMCRWKIGQAVVEFVPLEAYTNARGSPASDGARLWLMSHDAGKRLRLQTVDGWQSPTLALEAQIAALTVLVAQLQQTIAALPPTTTGPTVVIPAQGGAEGGEIQLADGAGGVWGIDCRAGNLRFVHDGVVVERWPK